MQSRDYKCTNSDCLLKGEVKTLYFDSTELKILNGNDSDAKKAMLIPALKCKGCGSVMVREWNFGTLSIKTGDGTKF